MCLGAIQYFDMHASVDVTGKRKHTSLGAGATERSDGAHKDNEGHKSSYSNSDDHRHWERLCKEQHREMSFYNYTLRTSQMYRVNDSTGSEHRDHLSLSGMHMCHFSLFLFCLCSKQ